MAELGLVLSHLFQQKSRRACRLAQGADIWSLRQNKIPFFLANINKPCIFHWGLGSSLADFEKSFYSEGLDHFLSEERIKLFSFDLGPSARHHSGILPLSRPLARSRIRGLLKSALNLVRSHYSGPIAVENYNYYPTGLYEHVTAADFIHSCVEEWGLGLTLDLAHGAVTAHNLGQRPDDYFASLPLEKVVELHISRPWLPDLPDLWAVDAHQAPEAREWQWLLNIMATGRLAESLLVFIEYYGDLAKLEKAQNRLAKILTDKK